MTDDEPWFYLDECKTDAELEFTRGLAERALKWNEFDSPDSARGAWRDGAGLVFFVDISVPPDGDDDRGHIVRTLPIELGGGRVLLGEDRSMQGWPALSPDSPNVQVLEGLSNTELMTATGDWIEEQLRRPIELHEWESWSGNRHKLWVLADVGRALSRWDSNRKPPRWWSRPKRITVVRDFRRRPSSTQ